MTTVPRTPPPVPAPTVRRLPWWLPLWRPASKPVRFACGGCGREFGSLWAMLEHREASCGKGERG